MFSVEIVYLKYPKTELKRAVSAQKACKFLSGIHSDKDPCHNRIGNWSNKNMPEEKKYKRPDIDRHLNLLMNLFLTKKNEITDLLCEP